MPLPLPPGYKKPASPDKKLKPSFVAPPTTGAGEVEVQTSDAPGFFAGKPVLGNEDNIFSPRTEGSLFPNQSEELNFYQRKYGKTHDFMQGGSMQGLLYKPKGSKQWKEIDPISPAAGQDLSTLEGWKGTGREVFQDVAEALPTTAEGVGQSAGATAGTAAMLAQTAGTTGVGMLPASSYPYLGSMVGAGLVNAGKQGLRRATLGEDETGKPYGEISLSELAKETALGPIYHAVGEKVITPAIGALKTGVGAIKSGYESGLNLLKPKPEFGPGVPLMTGNILTPEIKAYWASALEKMVKNPKEINSEAIPKAIEFLSQLKGIKDPLILEKYLSTLGIDSESEMGKKIISGVTTKLYPEMIPEAVTPISAWASQEIPPATAIPRFKNIEKVKKYIESTVKKLGGKKSPEFEKEIADTLTAAKTEFDPIFETGYNYVKDNLKGEAISFAGQNNVKNEFPTVLANLDDAGKGIAQQVGLINADGSIGSGFADLATLLDTKRALSKFKSSDPNVNRQAGILNKYVKSLFQDELNQSNKTYAVKDFLGQNEKLKSLVPKMEIDKTTGEYKLGDLFSGLEDIYGKYNSTLNIGARKISQGIGKAGTVSHKALEGAKRPFIETASKATADETGLSPAIRNVAQLEANRRMSNLFSKVTKPFGNSTILDTQAVAKMIDTPEFAQTLQYLKNAGDSENYYKLIQLREMFSNPQNWQLKADMPKTPFSIEEALSNIPKAGWQGIAVPAAGYAGKAAHTAASQFINPDLRNQLGKAITIRAAEPKIESKAKYLYNKLMDNPDGAAFGAAGIMSKNVLKNLNKR